MPEQIGKEPIKHLIALIYFCLLSAALKGKNLLVIRGKIGNGLFCSIGIHFSNRPV